ncbi:hypothetical protein ES703_86915 [subsurface metagenome]
MKAAVYARVSSDSQDVDLSISAQLRAVRDYAAKHGYEIVREYVDEAESGRSASRPRFREMIAVAKLKNLPFSAILVWKLNRFSRSRVDSVTYKTLLKNKGIRVISINEHLDESPSGQLLEGIIESVDEFYSASLGQDIKRGLRENRFNFHTSIAVKGGFFILAMAIISLKAGREALRPLSAPSTYSRTISYPCFAAYSLIALSWAEIDRSTS